MPKAIRFDRIGGPEVLNFVEVEVPVPAAGEAQIRHMACGLNLIDTYHRSGLYPVPLPSGVGTEAAGVVEAVGPGVTMFKPGDRVAYATSTLGAYSEVRNVIAERLVLIPDELSFEHAAAVTLKGMTVQYLVRKTHPVKSGEKILFHAAAGGVGLIACQWLRSLGAIVIGTAGSDEKCELAKRNGADYCINYRKENFVEKVKQLTDGEGVNVVYDSVGKDTFVNSLDCLKPRGLMVSFGNASGKVPPIEPVLLSQKGSLFLTRPTLFHYTSTREDLETTAGELFQMVTSSRIKVTVEQRYALKDAVQAHKDIESRKTIGSTVLLPYTLI